jgi:hypothetical protein
VITASSETGPTLVWTVVPSTVPSPDHWAVGEEGTHRVGGSKSQAWGSLDWWCWLRSHRGCQASCPTSPTLSQKIVLLLYCVATGLYVSRDGSTRPPTYSW